MKWTRDNCCTITDNSGYCCTVPKKEQHKNHEAWTNWGYWTGSKEFADFCGSHKPLNSWKNEEYEAGRGIAGVAFYSFDEYDLLPDAPTDGSLPTWEELNKRAKV